MTKKIIALFIISITEVLISATIIHFLETGNVLGWFVMGFLLIMFNAAFFSCGEKRRLRRPGNRLTGIKEWDDERI